VDDGGERVLAGELFDSMDRLLDGREQLPAAGPVRHQWSVLSTDGIVRDRGGWPEGLTQGHPPISQGDVTHSRITVQADDTRVRYQCCAMLRNNIHTPWPVIQRKRPIFVPEST